MLVKVLRFEEGKDEAPHYVEYDLPVEAGTELTVMDVLDYISEYQDPTISYYKHSACDHGICGRCLLKVNGKAAMACNTKVDPAQELILEPAAGRTVIKDLVTAP